MRMLITLMFSAAALAQSKPEAGKTPATELEAFQSRTGVVLIRGFSTVGTVRGMGGEVSVDAREFRDGSNPSSPNATGISITVKETSRLERGNISFVDYDEIDSLIKGVEYISKVGKDVTKLDHFEVDYRTKGDLILTVLMPPTAVFQHQFRAVPSDLQEPSSNCPNWIACAS